MKIAPIILFAYNRIDSLSKTIESLKMNNLARYSDLYIYIDGPKNDIDKQKVEIVFKYVNGIKNGFKSVSVIRNAHNKGLGPSIIRGVTDVIGVHEKAIVVEDDLYCTPNFLDFMNQALDFYYENNNIFSISGYGLKIKRPVGYKGDVYLSNRASSWGWATWKNRWDLVDWEVRDWNELVSDKKKQKDFNKGGSDMYSMLKGYMEGKNKSWAIRFCYSQYKLGKYSITPFLSKVENEGFGINATNCKQKYSRFKTDLDLSGVTNFDFPEDIFPNKQILKSCYKYHSLRLRLYSKIRKILGV